MIGPWTLASVAEQLGVPLHGPDSGVSGISIDTRTLAPGDLYIALAGENFDGHDFVDQAIARGAAGVLVDKRQSISGSQIIVADTQVALGRLGAMNRERFDGPAVAITGSCGKTTVKEMTAAILRTRGPVLATRGNLNNQIGVPLTLLALETEYDSAVIELGASGPGEIAWTVSLTRPQIVVLTNAQPAHLEGFGSLDGVVAAKGEIIDGLGASGTAVINLDDPASSHWWQRAAAVQRLGYSTAGVSRAKVTAADLALDSATGCWGFLLRTGGQDTRVVLGVPGRHNVSNGLAAAGAALALGFSPGEVATGLGNYQGTSGRLQVLKGIGGSRVIDDTYNANPGSVRAGIDVLREYPGKRILVLGDMKELGADAQQMHRDVGRYAFEQGIDTLLAWGEFASATAGGFGTGRAYSQQEALSGALQSMLDSEVTVLVKGSRGAAMEKVVSAIIIE